MIDVERIVSRIVWGEHFMIKPSIKEIEEVVKANLRKEEKLILCQADIKLICNAVATAFWRLYRWQISERL